MTLNPAQKAKKALNEAQDNLGEVLAAIDKASSSEKQGNAFKENFFDQLTGATTMALKQGSGDALDESKIFAEALINAYNIQNPIDKSGAGQVTHCDEKSIAIENTSQAAQKYYAEFLADLNIAARTYDTSGLIISAETAKAALAETFGQLANAPASVSEGDNSARVEAIANTKQNFLDQFENPKLIVNGEVKNVVAAVSELKEKILPEPIVESHEKSENVSPVLSRA